MVCNKICSHFWITFLRYIGQIEPISIAKEIETTRCLFDMGGIYISYNKQSRELYSWLKTGANMHLKEWKIEFEIRNRVSFGMEDPF